MKACGRFFLEMRANMLNELKKHWDVGQNVVVRNDAQGLS